MLGCLQSLSEKSPPQSGHLSSPLLSSFCCFSLSFTHLDSVGARLFLPSPFGNSRLPSSHIIPGAGGPTKCHASRVAPRLAFDVTFSGVTAPAGLVEQPDEHRGGQRGRGAPHGPTGCPPYWYTAVTSLCPAGHHRALEQICLRQGQSLPVLLDAIGLSQQRPSTPSPHHRAEGQ